MSKTIRRLGTAPVFLTAISTILGAIMFLRFGYAVGSVGFIGTLGIIVIGHLVTIPTALAIGEIATNLRVEGGGEYYIISRSFGINIGAAIGLALYLSQAISVAFYVIAFAEAFNPVLNYLNAILPWLSDNPFLLDADGLLNKRFITVPAMLILLALILKKGSKLGLSLLYVVVGVLFISLLLFFMGNTSYDPPEGANILTDSLIGGDNFFTVFAIVFPAFTGMTAGVGLSGDLKEPRKSIPLGTLAGTTIGMVIYVFLAYKLAVNASPEELVGDQLIMADIALWGPIIPIGLAAATISSAIGSILVAPRTLQAIGSDRVFPNIMVNRWMSKSNKNNEPFNTTLITAAIAFFFVAIGDVNAVAKVISMFFMVTYGSICLISFLEHFSSDPSYRPSFRSKWYVSLLGAVLCIWLMFKMNPGYAILSIIVMIAIYLYIAFEKREKKEKDLASIFKGAIWQLSRRLQIFLQGVERQEDENWRPSIICLSQDSFERYDSFEMVSWISHRYGFGTYIHHIKDYLSKESHQNANLVERRLLELAKGSSSNVFVDTIISPSFTASIAQMLQVPGVSGKENNMVLFEYARYNQGDRLTRIAENYKMVAALNFDELILGSSHKGFGYRREIHIWITSNDLENANLMILLGYIIIGHPEWNRGMIKIFAVFPEDEVVEQKAKLTELARAGRLPISPKNIQVIVKQEGDIKELINHRSADADLSIIGYRGEVIRNNPKAVFEGFSDDLSNILFVNTVVKKEIV